ncbi:DNA methyltransferase [uncultured Algoriphagus sp.]|uniref:DNA methyltransferase n=1 Tax=uncultured Algoriphagus sp. TaxID=417365 RepID=UPI002597E8CA|nr:DNA methyltransferase [uncultured Algoriphagus sp.]
MKTAEEKDTNEVSVPTIKVEEVSEKNLVMLNNPQTTCPKVVDYGYRYLPVVEGKFPENVDPSKLTPVQFRPVFDVSLDLIDIHPTAQMTYVEKDLSSLQFVIEKMGQIEPLGVVKRGNRFQVFDGISRNRVGINLGWEKIRVELFDYDDSELADIHVVKNMRTKRSLMEQILKAESVLGVLGKSQGKKREIIGNISLKDDDYGLVGKDRFQLTCAILGLEFSPSTLRKIIAVKEFEESGDEEIKGLGLMDKIQNKGMTISNAHNLMKGYQKALEERNRPNPVEEALDSVLEQRFKLFNKSSKDLSDLETESIQTAITSQPYFQMREYPEGVCEDEIPFGEEPTTDEFVKRSVEFYGGVKRVLKPEGSLFVNLGESYKNGASSLSTHKFVVAMVEDGWTLVQTIKWKKTNPKPQGGIKRLRPTMEEIFHFVKDPKNFKYKELIFWSRDEKISVQNGCNDEFSGDKKSSKPKFSLKKPCDTFTDFLESQRVQNVIEGAAFNWSKLRKIDPTFSHLAPAPDYLAVIPILMTSDPGDWILDIFNGSGSFLETSLLMGRNGVGFDTDPKSIEFSRKRLGLAIKDGIDKEDLRKIESEYFINAA